MCTYSQGVSRGYVAVKTWAPTLHGALLHLYTGNTTAAVIFERGRRRDSFIQACARELCLVCAEHDLTLVMSHVSCEYLMETADALSLWHTSQLFKDRVQ